MTHVMAFARTWGRIVILAGFWLVSGVFFHVETNGLFPLLRAPRLYFAFQHKRDDDPIPIIAMILPRLGWRAMAGDVRFSLRGDAFSPGFLARLIHTPRWLAHVVHPINAGPILRRLGIYRVDDARLRPLEEWVRLALAIDPPVRVGELLRPAAVQSLAARVGAASDDFAGQPARVLLEWRMQHWMQIVTGVLFFTDPWQHRLQHAAIDTLKRELAEIGQWLASGGAVMGSPEGGLSATGALGAISPAFTRVLATATAEAPITVVPLAIVYDFMTGGKKRIFIGAAPPFHVTGDERASDLAARMQAALRDNACFTTTQLGARFFVHRLAIGAPHFDEMELCQAIEYQSQLLHAQGRWVDPALRHPSGRQRRVRRFLRYARAHGILRAEGPERWRILPQDLTFTPVPGRPGYLEHPLAYAWNEWRDMMRQPAPATEAPPESPVTCRT